MNKDVFRKEILTAGQNGLVLMAIVTIVTAVDAAGGKDIPQHVWIILGAGASFCLGLIVWAGRKN